LFRNEAVGFIDWLGLLGLALTESCIKQCQGNSEPRDRDERYASVHLSVLPSAKKVGVKKSHLRMAEYFTTFLRVISSTLRQRPPSNCDPDGDE
jgi:hypothetical protein